MITVLDEFGELMRTVLSAVRAYELRLISVFLFGVSTPISVVDNCHNQLLFHVQHMVYYFNVHIHIFTNQYRWL